MITVTIEPLRYFTEAIAGDEFTVVSMVPKGSSPETYDPTPQQLVDLAQSKAYFRIGYIGFEQTWTEKLTDNAPHLQFFDMSENVELILDDTHAHHHKDGHVHEGHTHAGGVEPHIWNSTINAQIIAGNILNALCAIDKANESVYMERYNVLIRQIEHTDSLICQMLSSPNADRAFMIYHPALSYFARDYNLNQIPIEAGGKEPSPAHLKSLINSCKKEKVRIIFVQPEFDRRNADLIAQQTGTRVVAINPLSYDWEEEMMNTARALVKASLEKIDVDGVRVNVIRSTVGAISESDVSLAAASDAIIVGFQVRPSGAAGKMADQEGVDIRKYSVIYDAIEEVKAAMEGMLAPEVKEQVTATIEIREVFNITKVGLVAGAMVKTGKVKRSDKARLIRDGIVIFTGNINALKRFKDDVKEVGTNFECGISLVNCNDMKVGDMIETFEEIEVKQTL